VNTEPFDEVSGASLVTRFEVCSEAVLVATDRDPVPDGARVEWFVARDGVRIRVARWIPPGALRGTIVLLNGRTEFVEKYFEVIGNLLDRRYAVVTFDWRGQGLSDRLLRESGKGHVGHFDDYLADLSEILERLVEPDCPRPYTLMSHSMGGCTALDFLVRNPGVFASAIFSAPLWGIGRDVRPPAWIRVLANGLCGIGAGRWYLPGRSGPGESDRRFDDNQLTQDHERFSRFVAQFDAEPRLALGGPTIGWLRAAIAAIERLQAPGRVEGIRIPVRICTPLEDQVVSVSAQAAIAKRLQNAVQVEVSGAWHEILLERDDLRHRFWTAFDGL
jgi:lysophospholipase